MAEDDIIFRNKKGSYDNRKHNNFRLLAVHCLDFPLETVSSQRNRIHPFFYQNVITSKSLLRMNKCGAKCGTSLDLKES